VIIQKGMEVSWLSGVVPQRGEFEFYALLDMKPMKIFKDDRQRFYRK